MLKLNDSNIAVSQIKQILHDFNLPICEVGLKNPTPHRQFIHDGYFCEWRDFDINNDDAYYRLEPYKLNKHYLNLTMNLPIRNLIYDYETHEYLGKYLRFLRDYHGINLMSMYNCFAQKTLDIDQFNKCINIDTDTSQTEQSIFSNLSNKNCYSANISFNPLTLAINRDMVAYAGVCIMGIDKSVADPELIEFNTELLKATTTRIVGGDIVTLDLPKIIADMSPANVADSAANAKYQKKLGYLSHFSNQLFIVINVKSVTIPNICILEGKYQNQQNVLSRYFAMRKYEYGYLSLMAVSNNDCYKLTTADGNIKMAKYVIMTKYVVDPTPGEAWDIADLTTSGYFINSQLLNMVSKSDSCYLVADRLLEYLSGNVICPLSRTSEIKRVQKILLQLAQDDKYKNDFIRSDTYKYGIWNIEDLINLRIFITKNSNLFSSKFDLIGYVDKDVEKILGGALDNVTI